MSHARAKNLFQSALSQYAEREGIGIAYDNVKFQPKANETYLEVHLIPVDTDCTTLSGDGERLIGLYQVKIVVGSGTSTAKSDKIAEDLKRDVFKLNREFTDSTGFKVMVYTPFHVPEGRIRDGSWSTSCHFEYRADTYININ